MSLKEVKHIANGIRRVFEKIAGTYNKDLAGYCGRASAQLYLACKRAGVKDIELYSNDSHAFNMYRGRIIDITATQFGESEKIYIKKKEYAIEDHHSPIYKHEYAKYCMFVSESYLRKDSRVVHKELGF